MVEDINYQGLTPRLAEIKAENFADIKLVDVCIFGFSCCGQFGYERLGYEWSV
jgi:hypothetical protein